MSWYVKSKLINLKYPTDPNNLHVQCMYCSRWGTHPLDPKKSRAEATWKTYNELDAEEKADIEKIKRDESYASHGICSVCKKVIEKIQLTGLNPYKDVTPEDIRKWSLGILS